MKNPFLTNNDIFNKIDSKKIQTKGTSLEKGGYQGYTTTIKNENSVYSPLVTGNFGITKAQPLRSQDWRLNTEGKNGYERKQNIIGGYVQKAYKYQNVKLPEISQYRNENEWKSTFKSPNYNGKTQNNEDYKSNSMYLNYKSPSANLTTGTTFDTLDMKSSTYQISKMDIQLTRYLSNHDNIAQITKLFGLDNGQKFNSKSISSPKFQHKQSYNFQSRQQLSHLPSLPSSQYVTNPKMKQTFTSHQSTYQPFLALGQQDQDFNQQQQLSPPDSAFNCSFMGWTNKNNKGPLFQAPDQSTLQFSLKKNLMNQINQKCCRNNVRVMLTTDEKIRVTRYTLR